MTTPPTNRIRMSTPLIDSRSKAEQLLGEIAALTLDRNAQTIEMDRQLTIIREHFDKPIADLKTRLEEKTALLESWAANNPDEFAGKKSIEMLHGTFGYRTGNKKLQPILRKTWAKILETIKTLNFPAYIRTKEEVNREQILNDVNNDILSTADLRSIGLSVVQDEAFFVEPNLADLTNRQEAA